MLEDYVEWGDRVNGNLLQVIGLRFEHDTREFEANHQIHGVWFQGEEERPIKLSERTFCPSFPGVGKNTALFGFSPASLTCPSD